MEGRNSPLRDMSAGKTKQAERAANAFRDGSVIGMGTYRASPNGSSNSLKQTLPIDYVRHHDIEAKDKIQTWIDSETGALIILPEDADEC